MTQDNYIVMKKTSREKLIRELKEVKKENQQLKEKLNCKEYFSSIMPEDTEFVILTKNNYDRQQKDLTLENIKLKKQKDDVVKLIYKKMRDVDIYGTQTFELSEILRMLGEIDENR